MYLYNTGGFKIKLNKSDDSNIYIVISSFATLLIIC